MKYEVEIEFKESILLCTYAHTHQGFKAALEKINQFREQIVGATIISERDGVVFTL